jgi:N-acetylglucosaminyldiphosphoundecaprenol N-acetyl-beta-D-mannosaminyltransferase
MPGDADSGPGARGATPPFPTVMVGGVPVASASRRELVDAWVRDCAAPRREAGPVLVFDINAHGLSLRETDRGYRAAMAAADIIHADGQPIVWASRRGGGAAIPERSATTDMFHDFAEAAQAKGLSIYLLGGSEAVNRECAEIMQRTYPQLRIAGRRNGYFTCAEEPRIIADIAEANPDVLWIGLGKPVEQQFAVRNRHRLRAGWTVTCGGCFNYVTKHYPRAPGWMQQAGLEWLHRAVTGPRHLIWRYLVTNPHALWLMLRRA